LIDSSFEVLCSVACGHSWAGMIMVVDWIMSTGELVLKMMWIPFFITMSDELNMKMIVGR
jgi:hypothetical protein